MRIVLTQLVAIDVLHEWRILFGIANGLVGIGASASLLHGTLKNIKSTTKVYLVMVIVLLLLLLISICMGISTLYSDTLKILYQTDSCGADCEKTVMYINIMLTFDSIDLVAYTYFWICANSFLHELHRST